MNTSQANLGGRRDPRLGRSRYREWLLIGAVMLAVLLLLVGVRLWPQVRPNFPPLPQPNGYVDLVSAGELVRGLAPDEKDDTQKLREFVDANQAAIELVRKGLGKKSGVPLDFTLQTMQPHLDDLGRIRTAARVLNTASVLAECEGKLSDSVSLALDLVRFGPQMSRGGLLVDAQTGNVIGFLGRRRLNALRDRLDADTCRQVIDTLQETDSERELVDTVLERDYAWSVGTADWQMRAGMALASGTLKSLRKPADDLARFSEQRDRAQTRLLITHFANRRYRLSHGKNPDSLSDLVPNELSAVPLDPFNGRPLVYRLNAPGDEPYLLYSVGPDRADDRGQPVPAKSDPRTAKGDYLVE